MDFRTKYEFLFSSKAVTLNTESNSSKKIVLIFDLKSDHIEDHI